MRSYRRRWMSRTFWTFEELDSSEKAYPSILPKDWYLVITSKRSWKTFVTGEDSCRMTGKVERDMGAPIETRHEERVPERVPERLPERVLQ